MRSRLILIIVMVAVMAFLAGCGPQPLPYVPTAIPTMIPATLPAERPAEQESETVAAPTTETESVQPGAGDAAAGEGIFTANCSACHNLSEETKVGPGLAGLFDRSQLPNGSPVTDENLKEWIQTGGGGMPGIPVGGSELDDLLAFLKEATR